MELSSTFLKLQTEAMRIKIDKELLPYRAEKIKGVYDIFFDREEYEKCKIILDEAFTKDIEIIKYFIRTGLRGMSVSDDKLPFIMPESGIRYKDKNWFIFNNMNDFINFFDKSDIPKHIIFNELLPNNIHRIDPCSDGYDVCFAGGDSFIIKNKEYLRELVTNIEVMNSIKKISQKMFDYLMQLEDYSVV